MDQIKRHIHLFKATLLIKVCTFLPCKSLVLLFTVISSNIQIREKYANFDEWAIHDIRPFSLKFFLLELIKFENLAYTNPSNLCFGQELYYISVLHFSDISLPYFGPDTFILISRKKYINISDFVQSYFIQMFWKQRNYHVLSNLRSLTHAINRSSFPEVFCEKGALRNFAKFTGKHLCQSLRF